MTNSNFIFVLMPFSSDFDDVYEFGIKSTAKELDCQCERVDEQIFEENIVERIYSQIQSADIIIADMSGRNPNVFYEVGYAHALGKRVILLTQDSKDIPFDLKQYPHIIYNKRITDLKSKLKQTIDHYLKNPKPNNLKTNNQVRKFSTLSKTYGHIIKKMKNARRIDDISWGKKQTQEKSLADKEGYEEYLATKEKILNKTDVVYREIFTFPTKKRFIRAKELIMRNFHSYNAVYFPRESENNIPRMSFIIFDNSELVIFFYLSDHSSAYKEIHLAISAPDIVNLFQEFYDNIFLEGEILKEADFINTALLSTLEQETKDMER